MDEQTTVTKVLYRGQIVDINEIPLKSKYLPVVAMLIANGWAVLRTTTSSDGKKVYHFPWQARDIVNKYFLIKDQLDAEARGEDTALDTIHHAEEVVVDGRVVKSRTEGRR